MSDIYTSIVEHGNVSFAIGAVLLFSTLYLFLARQHRKYEVRARDISKGHRWFYPDTVPVYCNVCQLLVSGAGQCDSCGVVADLSCMKEADKAFPCKSLTGVGTFVKHHWVKGNLPCGCVCMSCGEDVGADDGLADFQCCWCKRTIHEHCLKELEREDQADAVCDLGKYRTFIVPPNCVRLKLVGWKGRRHLVVGEVRPPSDVDWSPLIIIANRKSGNNDGEKVLQAFRAFLNPVQVIDLNDQPLEAALEWCHLVSSEVCQILVAGGDGSIGWVLDAINTMKIEPVPSVAVLPLGTGNDLSRVLGWGEGLSGDVRVEEVFERLSQAKPVKLDRWKMSISSFTPMGLRLPSKSIYVNNYASVGVDALVALKFHQTRESKLYLYGSRLLNKFLFMSFATKDIWERECKNLHKKVVLWLDDEKIELPAEVEAVIVLNIPCWCAGVQPWKLGSSALEGPKQSFSDGIVEVFGVYSTFHIGQMQLGLSEPVRFGQAKHVKMHLTEKVPMQVDGEPWEQSPGDVFITFHSQATMLSCETSVLNQSSSSSSSSASSFSHLLA